MDKKGFKALYEGEWVPLVQNQKQLDILKYARANQFFCGDSPDMQKLVEKGLMVFVEQKSFGLDQYFNLTAAGRKELSAITRNEKPQCQR